MIVFIRMLPPCEGDTIFSLVSVADVLQPISGFYIPVSFSGTHLLGLDIFINTENVELIQLHLLNHLF